MGDLLSGRPIRILLTTDYYWPHLGGGVEVVVQKLAEGLSSRGHSVAVLTLNTRAAERFSCHNGVNVYRLPAIDLTQLVRLQVAAPLLPFKWSRILQAHQPDVIHVHGRFFSTSILAMLYCRRTPKLFTIHLGPVAISRAVSFYEKLVSSRLLRAADMVTAVSPLAAQVHPGSRVIPNGVDTKLFRPSPDAKNGFNVIQVGRLIRNKGPQRLLEAVPYINEKIGVAFVGDGPMRPWLEQRAAQLKVTNRVTFAGERDDVPQILASSSVLVRTSDTEGMSLSVLEALASGLPVIASQASAGDLIQHGVNGYRLESMSPQEIAGYVNLFHSDPSKLKQMSKSARKTAESFSWERAVDMYEESYSEVLRAKNEQ